MTIRAPRGRCSRGRREDSDSPSGGRGCDSRPRRDWRRASPRRLRAAAASRYACGCVDEDDVESVGRACAELAHQLQPAGAAADDDDLGLFPRIRRRHVHAARPLSRSGHPSSGGDNVMCACCGAANAARRPGRDHEAVGDVSLMLGSRRAAGKAAMASVAIDTRRAAVRPRFYVGMAAIFVLIAFGGFTPTYWARVAAGSLHGAPIYHLHGAVLFTWTLLFRANRARRRGADVDHRTWGLLGIALATAIGFTVVLAEITTMRAGDAAGIGDAARRSRRYRPSASSSSRRCSPRRSSTSAGPNGTSG